MTIYNPNFKPYDVFLSKTNDKHIDLEGFKPSNPDNVVPSFTEALNTALGNVNNLQLQSEQLQVAMITNPESIDPHQVSIAATKAEMALSFTNAITSRIINGFKDLQNLR
ncbi:MAG TPA: flagellar hook-basal body complex protein FliE [Spirochaetia bacterium]|nr:MAG: flagellar hook-basal body complex protein FliE [Spirochaetes bacterium GWB1_36_13]HCL58110.1 flagellar hook-basal body complex protein FliE [Spirochaetia bacterium]